MKKASLRFRIILTVGIAALVSWSVATGIAWYRIRNEINAILDTQQLIFAQRLADSDIESMLRRGQILFSPEISKKLEYERLIDKEALAFAVFDLSFEPLLNDGLYGLMEFSGDDLLRWASDIPLFNMNIWRIAVIGAGDGRHLIAVAQHLDYRSRIAGELIRVQCIPWLIVYPLLIGMIALMVNREFKPLHTIAAGLKNRSPRDTTLLDSETVPGEVRPFADALNELFLRISDSFSRERRFISDASHELRSPLAGLRVQAEVASLSGNDSEAGKKALDNLITGIDRTSRIVEQLLVLSRIDAMSELEEIGVIDWERLLRSVSQDCAGAAREKNITLSLDITDNPVTDGSEFLLSLMIRNILSNAVSYIPAGRTVTVHLDNRNVIVEDDGPGVGDEFIAYLGERFFRMPGNRQKGSGLGLSIVKRIAALHGMDVVFMNIPSGGLRVTVALA
ncbi:ATP-binding protein [Breznakiella homolactica]|uniref:histidine kinase n=1 Tax=Breznakiella homolactica TaxID=2798577 RepID=A0A7T7XR48_9SPIR|nr:ATP-binding protein [Breznakiella homolactica]QQO10964.1 hypothetical protein JFL75_08615 [Breznakiella homolactica]